MKKKNKAGTFFTPVVAVTGIFLAVIVFVSLFASVIAPYDPLATDVNAIYAPAFSEGHIFGTDGLGRDLFSRLICSARTSILNAFLIVAIEVVIGVPLGLKPPEYISLVQLRALMLPCHCALRNQIPVFSSFVLPMQS